MAVFDPLQIPLLARPEATHSSGLISTRYDPGWMQVVAALKKVAGIIFYF